MYKDVKSKLDYNINIKEFISEDVKEILIGVHGFAGDKESSALTNVAEALSTNHIGLIALDLPGHGASEVNGDFLTIDNCLNDIKSVIEYAKKEYSGAKISMFATSFGAYLTLLYITKYGNDFNKVILRCPAIKMDQIFVDEIINEDMGTFNDRTFTTVGYERELKVNYAYFKELVENNIIDSFKGDTSNMLIIHGDEDTTAPIKDAYEFAEKFNCKIRVVKGADHRFKKPGELEKVVEYAKEFILG